MIWLLGKFVGGKDFSIKGSTNRTGSFIAHRHPFQLFNSDLCVEPFSSHVVGAENLGAGDHLHAVLGLAEHFCPRLHVRVLVYHHLSKVPDDVIDSCTSLNVACVSYTRRLRNRSSSS